MTLVDLRDRMLYLRAVPPFDELGGDDLATLARGAVETGFRAGQTLVQEGARAELLWLIVEGEVSVTRQGRPVASLTSGDAVGVLGMLAQADEGIRAVAESEGLALCLGAEAILDSFDDSFSLSLHVMRVLARTLVRVRKELPGAGGLTQQRPQTNGGSVASLDLVERIITLRRALPWGHTGMTALAQLARRARSQRFQAGERVWSAGSESSHMLVLAGGVVRGRAASGQEFDFGRRRTLGALDVLAQQVRWYDASAVTDAVGLQIDWIDFRDVLEDQTELVLDTMVALARELLSLSESVGIDLTAHTRAARSVPPGLGVTR